MNLKQYWEKAISFQEYYQNSEQKIIELKNSTDAHDQEFLSYYQLGVSRTNRLLKTFVKDETQQLKWEKIAFKGKFLTLSEAWCGDASQVLPAIHLFFNEVEQKIVYRDENQELMNFFLSGGSQSIPIVIVLDENNNVITHWGPRANYPTQLLKEHKDKAEGFDKELFYKDLQTYYAKNKGRDLIEELIEKIKNNA